MINLVKDKSEDIISFLENTGYFLLNEQQKYQYKIFNKKDGSLLTELDLASELIIKNELQALFGRIPVLSEENEEKENIEIAKQKFFFLLDPIDGTKSFNKGQEFTINLSFCIDKYPVVSFIHNPIKKICLFGDKEQVYKRENGKIIKISKIKNIDYKIHKTQKKEINIACGSSISKEFLLNTILKINQLGYKITKQNIHICPALSKILAFINNKCDLAITSNLCKDWDTLPSLPILQAIGCSYYTNNEYVYKNNNFNSGILLIAKNNNLLEEIKPFFFDKNE